VHPLDTNEGHWLWVEKNRHRIPESLHRPTAEQTGYNMIQRGWIRQAAPNAYHIGRPQDVRRVRDHVLMHHPKLKTVFVDQMGGPSREVDVHEDLEGLAQARAATHPAPSEAQKRAGNYAKGKVQLHGMTIAIENARGSLRTGVSKAGVRWSNRMKHDYGYILGTLGKDKDHLDAFVGPHHESELVHVIDQYRPDSGAFDEHKIVFGARSTAEAKDIYHSNYAKGWKGLGHITPMHVTEFKAWLAHHNTMSPMHAQRRAPHDTFRTVREAIAAVADGVAPADVIESGWDDAVYLRGRHGAWLSPRGNFHPLQRGELHKDWVHSHAKELGVKVPKRPGRTAPGMGDTTEVEHDLLRSGWVKKSDATTYEAHSAEPRVLRSIRQHMREYHPDESHFALQVGKVGAGATGHYLPVWEGLDEGDVIRPPVAWWNDPVRIKLPMKGQVVPISHGVHGRTPRPTATPIDPVAFEKGVAKLRGVRAALDHTELSHRSKLPCPQCKGPTSMRVTRRATIHTCKDGWCKHEFTKPLAEERERDAVAEWHRRLKQALGQE